MQGPMALAPIAPSSIAAIGASAIGPCMLPVDADADRGDGGRRDPAVRQHLARHEDKVAPPVFLWSMLGPAGLRHQHLVRAGRRRQDPATLVYDDALGFEGTNVDAKIVLHSR